MTLKLLTLIFIILIVTPVSAQQKEEPCKTPITYENRNQIEYSPLPIQIVSGVAQDKDGARIPGVCLGLFTEKEHRLVATAVTDEEGNFQFNQVPPGRYRLVAKYSGFCPANTLLRLTRRASNKKMKTKTLVLHMETAKIDHCSYGDYK
jgi:hypothetical protein